MSNLLQQAVVPTALEELLQPETNYYPSLDNKHGAAMLILPLCSFYRPQSFGTHFTDCKVKNGNSCNFKEPQVRYVLRPYNNNPQIKYGPVPVCNNDEIVSHMSDAFMSLHMCLFDMSTRMYISR